MNSQVRRIYISYATDGREYAAALTSSDQGIDVDWSDPGAFLLPGNNFQADLKDRLSSASILLVLLTAGAVKSSWVSFEIGAFVIERKPIIFALLGETNPAAINYKRYPFIDARSQTPALAAHTILDVLLRPN